MRVLPVLLASLISASTALGAECIGHRGFGVGHPDNSLSAVRAALDTGIDGIEVDLRETADQVAILQHDPTLIADARGKGCELTTPVANLHVREIEKNCRLLNREKVPRLKEMLSLVAGSQLKIFLDLKVAVSDGSVLSVTKSGIDPQRFRLLSFHDEFLQPVKETAVVSGEDVAKWNSIPRYRNSNYTYSETLHKRNLYWHLAFFYGLFMSERQFGAWGVDSPLLLRLVQYVDPRYIITRLPVRCRELRK